MLEINNRLYRCDEIKKGDVKCTFMEDITCQCLDQANSSNRGLSSTILTMVAAGATKIGMPIITKVGVTLVAGVAGGVVVSGAVVYGGYKMYEHYFSDQSHDFVKVTVHTNLAECNEELQDLGRRIEDAVNNGEEIQDLGAELIKLQQHIQEKMQSWSSNMIEVAAQKLEEYKELEKACSRLLAKLKEKDRECAALRNRNQNLENEVTMLRQEVTTLRQRVLELES